MERDFKGVWICKEIWLDNKLTWMEKLFITEINSLDKEQGCFASNNYFANFFNVSPGRCSQIINSLIQKGYMSAEYEREGKEIKKRVLRILNTPIKNSKGGIKNIKDEYLENDKDNNTLINNTINNRKKDTLNLTSAKSEPVPKVNRSSAKSEPEPVPKVNTQKKKETITKENSPHHKLIEYFNVKYLELTGNKFDWSNSRHVKNIKLLLKNHTEKEIYNKLSILEDLIKQNGNNFFVMIPDFVHSQWNNIYVRKGKQNDKSETPVGAIPKGIKRKTDEYMDNV